MKIALGGFARSEIEAQLGSDLVAGVELALRQYARRLRSRHPPPGFPRFELARRFKAAETELDVDVEPEVAQILQHELSKSDPQLSPGQLVKHAVLVYLAELDARA
jgi:hypothetical protein